jgi:hypothetical protein
MDGDKESSTEAEFLDEIQTKVLRVFLIAIHSHLYIFALRFLFLKTHETSYNFYVQLLYTVKEKGEKPEENNTPFPMVPYCPCLLTEGISVLYLYKRTHCSVLSSD